MTLREIKMVSILDNPSREWPEPIPEPFTLVALMYPPKMLRFRTDELWELSGDPDPIPAPEIEFTVKTPSSIRIVETVDERATHIANCVLKHGQLRSPCPRKPSMNRSQRE
jgi:hypothetical protein